MTDNQKIDAPQPGALGQEQAPAPDCPPEQSQEAAPAPAPAQPASLPPWDGGPTPPAEPAAPQEPPLPPGWGPPQARPQPMAWAAPPAPQPGPSGYSAWIGQPPKKRSRGLKVFLWLLSALSAGALLGFGIFVASWAIAGPSVQGPSTSQEPSAQESPWESQAPDSQDPAASQEESQLVQPDVDVTPNTEGIQIHQKPQGEALSAQEAYDQVVRSTVAVTVTRDGEGTDSAGTGIVATSDGYIITNAHVVLNTKNVLVTVTTYDGQEYDAVVVGLDRTTDLAVIKTDDHQFTPAQFGDAGELSIGEWVLAIGNPGGERFTSSLTRGIISGLDRAVDRYSENGMTYIQTDAAINPGNSGGPLVNMYGQVVGINSSKIITEGYEGMGFAIPVSRAKEIIDQLLSGGYVEGRVRLGISGYDLGSEAAFYGLPRGFMIASMDEDSSFAAAGAQVNDIIVAIDGETVEELQDISNLLLRYSPGDQVDITLYRQTGPGEGEEVVITVTLLEDKGETQR